MSLRDAAAAAAAAATNGTAAVADTPPMPTAEGPSPEVIAYEEATPPGDPEPVPVYVAWNRVMKDVRAVAKLDKVESGPARFSYRGVDRAIEAFGPACRRHGVLVIPEKVEASYASATTSQGKPARECTVLVTYRIYGPKGDSFTAQAAGESLDSGDKGTAKAQAVALRTLLYHAGLVPTRDVDPDAVNLERGEAPIRTAVSYMEEALNPATSKARLRQMYSELSLMGRLYEVVLNEHGQEERIGALINRVAKERS